MSHVDNELLRRFRSMLFHHPLLLKGWNLYAAKWEKSLWFKATRPLIKEFLDSWEDYEYLVLSLYEPSHFASISYEVAHVFDATFGTCMQVGTTACVTAFRLYCSRFFVDAPYDTASITRAHGVKALICVLHDNSPNAIYAESRPAALWYSTTRCRVLFIVLASCTAFWHWCVRQASIFHGSAIACVEKFDLFYPTMVGPTDHQVRIILVENQPTKMLWPILSPDAHTILAHTLKTRCDSAYHPSLLRICERMNISLVRAD